MTLNCKGEILDLSTPRIMGILNVTPDSFYDGGKYQTKKQVLEQVERMLNEGATFIDVGGYSSRPHAIDISEQEEMDRVIPTIENLIDAFPDINISIDTFRSNVALAALDAGAVMINDISGALRDKRMLEVAAEAQVPIVLMHMKGTPQTMVDHTEYDHLLTEILQYFSERLAAAKEKKINDVILDPGFGFAKTIPQNYELLEQLAIMQTLQTPVLVGVSRKSMIYKPLEINPLEALNATTALHMVALERGAHILRVHDVKPAMECIEMYSRLKKYSAGE